MKYVASFLFLGALLVACGGSGEESTVTVIKSVESIQCVTVAPTPAQLDAELAGANISPISKSCASDGKDRSFACGVPTLYLRIIEIHEHQANAAAELGYKTKENYDVISPISC